MTPRGVCGADVEPISTFYGRAYALASKWPGVAGHRTGPRVSEHVCVTRGGGWWKCSQIDSDYANTIRKKIQTHTHREHASIYTRM